MTGKAGLLRLLFAFYGKKPIVNFILGEGRGRFLWSHEKKNENSGTDDEKCRIYQKQLFSIFFLHRKFELEIFRLDLNEPFQCG